MQLLILLIVNLFYNHLILSGTKIGRVWKAKYLEFYNHLILSGTKMSNPYFQAIVITSESNISVTSFQAISFYNHIIIVTYFMSIRKKFLAQQEILLYIHLLPSSHLLTSK